MANLLGWGFPTADVFAGQRQVGRPAVPLVRSAVLLMKL